MKNAIILKLAAIFIFGLLALLTSCGKEIVISDKNESISELVITIEEAKWAQTKLSFNKQ